MRLIGRIGESIIYCLFFFLSWLQSLRSVYTINGNEFFGWDADDYVNNSTCQYVVRTFHAIQSQDPKPQFLRLFNPSSVEHNLHKKSPSISFSVAIAYVFVIRSRIYLILFWISEFSSTRFDIGFSVRNLLKFIMFIISLSSTATVSSIILVNNLRVYGPGLNPFAPYNMANYFTSR